MPKFYALKNDKIYCFSHFEIRDQWVEDNDGKKIEAKEVYKLVGSFYRFGRKIINQNNLIYL